MNIILGYWPYQPDNGANIIDIPESEIEDLSKTNDKDNK